MANREPYIHVRTPDGVRLQRPASGLVTALEPVMRACSGTWIAHGSGTADRVRTGRLRRDPRCTLYVHDPGYAWLALETTVTILDGSDTQELNLRLFRVMQDPTLSRIVNILFAVLLLVTTVLAIAK